MNGSSLSDDSRRRKGDEKELDRDSGRSRYEKNGESYRHSDRYSSRSSQGYSRNDDYSRHESVVSHSGRESKDGERGRSRDYARNVENYSRDRYDGSGHRNRDKEKELSEHPKLKDKDFSPERGSAQAGKDGRDDKRDYHRSSGDHKSDRSSYYEETRGYRNDSSGRDRLREPYKNDPRELNSLKEKKKHDNRDTSRDKDRYSKAPGEKNDDKSAFGSEKPESPAKKPKLFSFSKDPDYSGDVNEKQSSSSMLAQEVDNKVNVAHTNNSDAANDLDAAKVAAMKAAELVNKNLVGVGFMSTEQKKKLLWGSKKSVAPEETGRRWDTVMFGDRERQEKFNKLMSLSLPWCLWPIVGCKRRGEGGAPTRQSRCRETEGTPDGSRKTVYCWASTKRWPHCRIGSLSICFRSHQTLFPDILLPFCARITISVTICACHVCPWTSRILPKERSHLRDFLILIVLECSCFLQFCVII
ncbi:arginine/serine-rich coiled-coil protein [Salix suchowensis]|nr:arginine/serine-rich coiled-coil protein [Salix suchowensis]